MEWKAMPPGALCDLIDFWRVVRWPLPVADVYALGVRECGWSFETQDGTEVLMNRKDGFTIPHVTVVSSSAGVTRIDL